MTVVTHLFVSVAIGGGYRSLTLIALDNGSLSLIKSGMLYLDERIQILFMAS